MLTAMIKILFMWKSEPVLVIVCVNKLESRCGTISTQNKYSTKTTQKPLLLLVCIQPQFSNLYIITLKQSDRGESKWRPDDDIGVHTLWFGTLSKNSLLKQIQFEAWFFHCSNVHFLVLYVKPIGMRIWSQEWLWRCASRIVKESKS